MAYVKPTAQAYSSDPRVQYDLKHNPRVRGKRARGRARQESFAFWCHQTNTLKYRF